MVNVKAMFRQSDLRGSMVIFIVGVMGIGIAFGADPEEKSSSYAPVIRCFNIAAADLNQLRDAAGIEGLNLQDAAPSDPLGMPALVLWEANHSTEPDEARITELSEYVQRGGRLVLTLDASPGTGPFRLKALSPTTAWRTLLETCHRGGAGPAVDAAEWDAEMFPESVRQSLHLPYYYALRPFDAVERGMQRYERFDRPTIYPGGFVHAGDPTFTRPLLDRDWKVRIRADDVGASGLLITGRFGAGRVAVFASSARAANAAVWGPLLKWLDIDRPAQPIDVTIKSLTVISSAQVDQEHHAMIVAVSNEGGQQSRVEVIARVLTWEHALLGDVVRTVDIGAKSRIYVALPLPTPSGTEYQAIDAQDAFIVRLGIIGNQGSTLVEERDESVDFRPPVRVTVSLDNLRQLPYPFKDVPDENAQQSSMPNRMGEPVTAYAYPSGAEVNVAASISNGMTDLAPLATITDETQPGNPSVVALNDQFQPPNAIPADGILAYGVWTGREGMDNSLLFTFPCPMHINDVIISGNPANLRGDQNPGEVVVEANGEQVTDVKHFDSELAAQSCAAHVPFETVSTSAIRVRFPWIGTLPDGKKRLAPRIGEIEIRGYMGLPGPSARGKLRITLSDAATKSDRVVMTRDVQLPYAREQQISVKIPAEALVTDASRVRFFRVEAQFASGEGGTSSASSTFMTIQPVNPLRPVLDIHQGPQLGFVVTRGFRNAFTIGTGTRETHGAWDTPDDLIWAYERQLKQMGAETRSTARQFFVSECDFKHYCAPWSVFPNGQVFFYIPAPSFVAAERKDPKWNQSDLAQLGFGDRWDTGPAASLLYSWPELIAFDEFLRSQRLPGLSGRTREEVVHEIQEKYGNCFSAWHMARYANIVKTLRDTFRAAGKKLIISGQGIPLVPGRYQQEIADTIQGMSDDTTWGMTDEDVAETTGRQIASLAYNPVWSMCEVLVWGYDSAVLNNSHWHAAVGTTESSRRHYADAGWRGFIDPQGKYRLTNTYGYGMNANVSFCMSLNDWQEAWRMQERLSLITPDAPIGVGMVIGNDSWNDMQHATFSGGGMGGSPADSLIGDAAHAFATLCDQRIPISFGSNVTAMAKWSANTPIVVLNLADLSANEIKILQSLHQRGTRMIGFTGGGAIPPAAAAIFGAMPDGGPDIAKTIGTVLNRPVLVTATTLLLNIPYQTVEGSDLQTIAAAMRDILAADLQLPEGTTGYGFIRGRQRFVVVEDWREEGRDVAIRLRVAPRASTASCVNVNDHVPVTVSRDGNYWVLTFPTRPGDGTLLCVEEK